MAQVSGNAVEGLEGIFGIYGKHLDDAALREDMARIRNSGLLSLIWGIVGDEISTLKSRLVRTEPVTEEKPIERLDEWCIDVVETSDANVAYVIQYEGPEREFTKANLIRIESGVPQHIGGVIFSGDFSGEKIDTLLAQLREDYSIHEGGIPTAISLDGVRMVIPAKTYHTTELGDAFEATIRQTGALQAMRSYGTNMPAFVG